MPILASTANDINVPNAMYPRRPGRARATASAAMNATFPMTSTRYSSARSTNVRLENSSADAGISAVTEKRPERPRSANARSQNGICAHRSSTTEPAPGPSANNRATGANTIHCSGVWCSQKSRNGTRPSPTHFVARKNSISSGASAAPRCSSVRNHASVTASNTAQAMRVGRESAPLMFIPNRGVRFRC